MDLFITCCAAAAAVKTTGGAAAAAPQHRRRRTDGQAEGEKKLEKNKLGNDSFNLRLLDLNNGLMCSIKM